MRSQALEHLKRTTQQNESYLEGLSRHPNSSLAITSFTNNNLVRKTSTMTTETGYRLSFTTGGLNLSISEDLINLYLDGRSWEEVKEVAVSSNATRQRALPSRTRLIRECMFRLRALDNREIEVFVDGQPDDRKLLLWVAICRTYPLIDSFARQVLRQYFLSMRTEISYTDFDYFYEKQSLHHPELDDLTESSRKKLRQVLFRIMREAGLISAKNEIQPCILSPRLADLLSQNDSNGCELLPTYSV